MTTGMRSALLMAFLATGSGCSTILAPICLAQQKRTHVATITGEIAPGALVVHVVRYGIEGSQNDLAVTWSGQSDPDGPRLRVYATLVGCERFDPHIPRVPHGDPCASIGWIGSVLSAGARPCVRDRTCQPSGDDLVQRSLGISHGRGNLQRLGPDARYKLWIVADPHQQASYTITITSFYGPDC